MAGHGEYRRRAGSEGVLHEAVGEALGALREEAEALGGLPRFLLREVYRQRRCGLLEFGFVVVKCPTCGEASQVAFSCKSRLCPSCSARRAHETAVHLVEAVLPHVPYRQWTVSFPYALRWRLVKEKGLLEELLQKTTRLIAAWQRRCARKLGVQGHLLTGAVTQVQYWGSAVQLSPHFHTLAADGVFVATDAGVDFVALSPPTPKEVANLVAQLARRVTKVLRKRGLEDAQAQVDDGLDALRLESLQASLALGNVRGVAEAEVRPHHRRVAVADGISLHADTAVRANDRQSLEQLCRYGARGPLATSRLSWREDGKLSYRMKRPVRGREVLVMTPLQLLKKLAAVTPPRGKHLVHFHGMFGPAARHRSAVVASGRPPPPPAPVEPQSSLPLTPDSVEPRRLRPPRLDWASLLRKTFGFEVLHCPCGGRRQVLAAVTDWQHIDEELRKRGLEPTLRARVVPTHLGPRQAELALDLAAVPRPRSHSPPRGADVALAS